MGTCYRSSRIEEKGKCVVDALLDGRVDNFESYAYRTLGDTQRIETRACQIGTSVVKYLQTVEDEEFVKSVFEKIMQTSGYTFIEVFRVAQDLSTKLDRYKGSTKMKNSYLLRHPDLREPAYKLSLWMANYLADFTSSI